VNLKDPAWLFVLLLLPAMAAAALWRARHQRRRWAALAAPRLEPSLLLLPGRWRHWAAFTLLLAACALLAGALARPRADGETIRGKTTGRNVLFALDISRSMRAKDVKPDRLSQAKTVLFELIEALPQERIGLIGFAGDAHLYAPLTVDHAAVRETVEQIDEQWAPVGGSDLTEAVDLAISTLRKTGQQSNALVIVSDGEKHEGDISDLVDRAERSGIYILAIGVGTEDGDFIPDPEEPGGKKLDRTGKPVLSRLQADVMRELASGTKGRFAVAGSGADITAMVGSSLKDLEAFEFEGRERKVSLEFYQWVLLPAIVLLVASFLAATRWRRLVPKAALIPLLLAATLRQTNATPATETESLLKEGKFPEAREAYRTLAEKSPFPERSARFRLGEGSAAYREGAFKHARSAFSASLLSPDPEVAAHAHSGLGCTMFQLGWQSLFDKPYPADEGNPPRMEDFDNEFRDLLARIRKGAAPAASEDASSGDAGESRIRNAVLQWSDGVRHNRSALALRPGMDAAARNRDLTMRYLTRLRELLDEEKEQTEGKMPPPSAEEGQPRDDGKGREDENGDPENGEGEDGKQNPSEKSGKQGDPRDGQNNESPRERKKGTEPDAPYQDGQTGTEETPQERARRILGDNADSEKGPVAPGRIEFKLPAKDW
jgi:Ca-activated chloride channel family protein